MNDSKEKYIFSFWEPKDKVPEYLKLCMKTWAKFLPEYKIILLDYQNVKDWLGEDIYPSCLYEEFSLPIQADAIRCALLQKYGGIWFDCDTIITSEKAREYLNIESELILIGTHIGFIIAKQNGKILNVWKNGIDKKLSLVNLHNKTKDSKFINFFIEPIYKKNIVRWDALGNSIIRKSLKTKNKKLFYSLNRTQIKALPEVNFAKENNIKSDMIKFYQDFYFNNEHSEYALNDNGGVIYLHNSWTPKEYKEMSEVEFLNSNNTLSQILKKILSE